MPSFGFHLALLCPYSYYCSFQKHAFFAAFKHLSGPLDLLGNRVYFNGFKTSWFVTCDRWISIRFVCVVVLGFVACARYG